MAPESVEDVRGAIERCRRQGKTIAARGSGYSYGDVALNRDSVVLDVRPMRRVLAWDPVTGIIDVEPGVTVGDLCRHVSPQGWWPPVIPGATAPTVGGCVAVNAHGKNNWKAGPIGEHVREVDVILADGSLLTLRPHSNQAIFRAVVGSFGLSGIITRVQLQMERSANILHVEQYAAPQLEDVMGIVERWEARADYVVAWLDGFASGENLGRGLVQIADRLPASETVAADGGHPEAFKRPRQWAQSNFWIGLKPVARNSAFKKFNALQFAWGTINSGRAWFVPRTRFEFFHDLIPDWNRAFAGGIVQYQMFVPREQSARVFRSALLDSQAKGFPPFLAVLKRHRRDDFLLSYGVDGWSLSLDFHPGLVRLAELTEHLRRMTDDVVLPAGGRFYLAKDSVLLESQLRRSLGTEAVDRFLEIKRELDPDSIFQSDMYRRVFVHPSPDRE